MMATVAATEAEQKVEEGAQAQLVPSPPPPKASGKDDGPGNTGAVNEGEKAKAVSMSKLFSYADKNDKVLMAVGTVAAVISACAFPYFIGIFGDTLDALNDPANLRSEVNKFAVYFTVIGAVALVCGFIMAAAWSMAGERQATRIRAAYVSSILRQDIAWFDMNPAGQLPTIVTNNLAKVQDGIGRKFVDIILNGLSGLGLLVAAMVINPELGGVTVACVPLCGGGVAILALIVGKSTTEGGGHYARAGAVATEVLSGIRTVASLNAEQNEVDRYAQHLDKAEESGVKEGLVTGLGKGVTFMAMYLTYAFAFWYGSTQIYDDFFCNRDGGDDCVSGGEVLSAVFGILFAAMMFGQTAPGVTALGKARGAAVDVFSTIDREPPIDSSSSAGKTPSEVEGRVSFEALSFSYPARPNDKVYESVNLEVGVGETLALVGPSGGGKSTATKLLLRFYDPTSGRVALDGVDIRTLNVAWYRSQIGYVGQEPVLFAGSISDNITTGKPGASEEEVIAAAKAANAHTFVKGFPDGYKTDVGQGGLQLSGGQKQRIAIARAIIKDPAILLLDEATSALDSQSEKVVQDALDALQVQKKRTTITIAHRLSTIQNSDRIAVMANKGVAELGTHKELMALDGIYAGLVTAQGVGDGEEAGDAAAIRKSSVARTSSVGDGQAHKQSSTAGGGVSGFFRRFSNRSSMSSGAAEGDGAEGAEGEGLAEGGGKGEEEEKVKPAKSGRLWKMSSPDWPWMLLGLFGAIVAGSVMPSEGIIVAQAQSNFYLDDREEMKRRSSIFCLAFVGLAMAALVGNTLLAYGFAVAGERLTKKLRLQCFTAIVRHDVGWFDMDDNATGLLTTRLEADAGKVRSATTTQIANATTVLASLSVGIIVGLIYAWQIGLLALAMVPLVAAGAVVQMAMFSGGYGDSEGLDGGGEAAKILGSALNGMITVTALNLQEKMASDYSQSCQGTMAARQQRGFVAGMAFGYSQGIIFWVFAILFWFGGKLVSEGTVSYEDFFTSMFATMLGAFGVGMVTSDTTSQTEALMAAGRIFNITDEELKVDPLDESGAKPNETIGALTFEGIQFAYPARPNMQIYGGGKHPEGFCLSVVAGETVALVGPSGSGKSTCMALLLRFYDPADGTVSLDGRDVRELNVHWLRAQIGYVGQEPVLFTGTVRENIARGKPGATEEEIVAAAKASNAHDFVSAFDEGYGTDVGEKSALLSGGQKQRIAIARAIIKDPAILLLDEATSALDNESEHQVQEALDKLQAMKKRTTLTVAHRLTTIRNSNKIAVLKGGGVGELGTHDELLAQKGLYHQLWHQQTDHFRSAHGAAKPPAAATS